MRLRTQVLVQDCVSRLTNIIRASETSLLELEIVKIHTYYFLTISIINYKNY